MVGFYKQRGLIFKRKRALSQRSTFISNQAGSFTRSSVATFRTGTATVTSTAIDVLRFQNLGDGNGANAFYEGSRTNLNPYSRDLGSWTAFGSNIGYSNAGVSPDGTSNAGRITKPLTPDTGPYIFNMIAFGTPKQGALSLWYKDNGGTLKVSRLRFSASTGLGVTFTGTGAWQYADFTGSFTGPSTEFLTFDTRLNTPNSGNPAINGPIDMLVYGVQLEPNCLFPSSTIYTNGLAATRAADVNVLTTGQYSSRVLTDPSQGYVIPEWSSSEVADGNEFWLYSFGGANSGVRLRKASGNVKLECVDGGSVQVASNALTYSRNQRIDFILDPVDGGITVSNATSGNGSVSGSSWVFDSATCRIGGVVSATNELFGSISDLVSV